MSKGSLNLLFIAGIVAFLAFAAFVVLRLTVPDEITPAVLRVGILPDENVEILRQRYAPLLKHLSSETGIETQLILPSDYRDLVELFRQREVDLAYFGGLTFVQASVMGDAEPLVVRDIDTRFTSWFLAKGSEKTKKLSDFKDKKFAFGNLLSTSGHLMPRHFMQSELQIVAETFFSEVGYSGAHDTTALQVRDGEVDLGVANPEIIKLMIRDGRLKENDLQLVWETPPYIDYVWAVPKQLNESTKTALRNAFLELNTGNAVHKKILAGLSAQSFLPVGINDFLRLKKTAEGLNMLGSELK